MVPILDSVPRKYAGSGFSSTSLVTFKFLVGGQIGGRDIIQTTGMIVYCHRLGMGKSKVNTFAGGEFLDKEVQRKDAKDDARRGI